MDETEATTCRGWIGRLGQAGPDEVFEGHDGGLVGREDVELDIRERGTESDCEVQGWWPERGGWASRGRAPGEGEREGDLDGGRSERFGVEEEAGAARREGRGGFVGDDEEDPLPPAIAVGEVKATLLRGAWGSSWIDDLRIGL